MDTGGEPSAESRDGGREGVRLGAPTREAPPAAPQGGPGPVRDTGRRVGIAAVLALAIGGAASLVGFTHDLDARRRFDDTELVAHVAMSAESLAARLRARAAAGAAAGASSDPLDSDLTEWDRAVEGIATHALSATERVQLLRLQASLHGPRRDGDEYLATVEAAQALLLASVRAASDPAVVAGLPTGALARTASLGAIGCAAFLVVWLVLIHGRQRRRDRDAIGALGELLRTDPLTGITNRRGLDENLPAEMARTHRSGSLLTVVMIDLDWFKRYNSRRGHGGGDSLLRTASQRWRRQLRPSDLLARYGGEEFTLVLPQCDSDQALLLVERLRPVMPDSQTFSAGVATWDGLETPADLLRRADTALLEAKKHGRNRTVVSGREEQIPLPLPGSA
jgi:diguanylate cyclase (GGDEF)-like protein